MNEHLTSTSLSSIFVDGGGSTADFLLSIMFKFQPYIKYQPYPSQWGFKDQPTPLRISFSFHDMYSESKINYDPTITI